MILEQKYNRADFIEFLRQFLPDFKKEERSVQFNGLQVTKDVRLMGQSEQLDLQVFEFTHKSSLDARVSLAKDGFKVMKDSATYCALAVYRSEESDDWRLSLMTAEHEINEKGKIKQSFSNPRRYSFFLGPEARMHTPEEFLIKKGKVKDGADLISRFDVEIVTKEFFAKYKGLYEEVREYFEKDHAFKNFAATNNIEIDTFAKKLLGQIVFCYFLQRKGWLGARRGESISGGDRNFMRSLFNRPNEEKPNFYNDCLEHLFYGCLNAKAEGAGDFYRKYFDCQIPFLNGGLFEPPEDYDWKKSFIHIPDTIFSNKKKTGILDVFDLYNFTIYEDDPVDREVSVDPEMLGKVFENLLPENLRKGQGAYYTPREIVHYMCQESLINYLITETGVEEMKVRKLIVSKEHSFVGDGDLEFSSSEAEKLDKALTGIKVCDPACGSGAFLVGMLHEIVMARCILNSKEHEYHLKKEVIQSSIYGVDVDPGAVEIAKLRLWLSLVVDHELKDVDPLPNFDYKIMCGNSLLEEFEGVRFYDGDDSVSLFKDERKEKIEELRSKTKEYFNIFDEKEKRRKREEINKLKDWFIKTTLEKRRKEITAQRRKIEAKANMFEEKSRKEYFTTQGEIFLSEAKILEVLRELHNPQKARPFFIWKLEFMDVFEDKGGFDVIIANPPYVGEKGHKEMFREIKQGNLGKFYQGKMDLFYFFFHLALDIGKQNSNVVFITTNYYPTAMGARKLRQDFQERAIVKNLINFNELKIFESALGQHNMITVLEKILNKDIMAQTCIVERQGVATPEILQKILNSQDEKACYYKFAQKDLYDGEEHYIRLAGNLRISDDPVQIVLEKIRSGGELLSVLCRINNGIHTEADYLSAKKYNLRNDKNAQIKDGIYILNNSNHADCKQLSSILCSERESKYLKPFFKNSDIHKWSTVEKTDKKIIYINKQTDNINNLPLINKHISRFKTIIEESSDNSPYLHRPKTESDFLGSKIVAPQRSSSNTFGYNDIPWYAASDVFFITEKDKAVSLKYILALINSSLYYLWLYHRGKRKGEALELITKPLSEIPIKKISGGEQKLFIEIVDKILTITKSSDYLENSAKQSKVKEYERQIDQMVYKLYGLTDDEIAIVENSQKTPDRA